ncbi:phospholipase domain-containing protein [Arthrobacter sp. fls2-241-R2A-200]|uniref:phospholipase domain-containing protein n=1 Tax=Arthrobacter sp. fls2-241-R2A-200 TaxID=3040281 RepID=UPI003305C186
MRVTVTANGKSPHAQFRIENDGATGVTLTVTDAYGAGSQTVSLTRGEDKLVVIPTQGGWYDLTVTSAADPKLFRVLAGRLENGSPLTSDPQLGQ